MDKYYGIIDIGSNSVRLMVSQGDNTLTKFTTCTKLAEGLAKTHRLSSVAMQRSLDAIEQHLATAKEYNAEVHIFATEAVRSAENGKEFVNLVLEKTGYEIHVVSGDEEAKLGFTGASFGGSACVVDIGGASTEIVCGDNGKICYAKSLPIGAVRLLDNCAEDEEKLKKFIGEKLLQYEQVPKQNEMIAIGGTASTIVGVLLEMEQFDSKRVHNYRLCKNDILQVYEKIKNTPLEERFTIKGLTAGRREIIVGATLELLMIMEYLGYESIIVSERDNQEGYLMIYKDGWK